MLGSYFSKSFLRLESCGLIASGSERECYILPGYENLCVKVSHSRDRYKNQNNNDYKYYALLSKKKVNWGRLAKCHGWIATDRGCGLVFDLIKDADESPSIMLDQYLKVHGLNDEVVRELGELREYLLLNNIIVCDLRDRNIACQMRRDGMTLKLIDGVGNRDFIKFCDWSRFLGRQKINRHWKKFEKHVEASYFSS